VAGRFIVLVEIDFAVVVVVVVVVEAFFVTVLLLPLPAVVVPPLLLPFDSFEICSTNFLNLSGKLSTASLDD